MVTSIGRERENENRKLTRRTVIRKYQNVNNR